MSTWQVIYEYCNDHPNCTDAACQKTVLIQSIPDVPAINLVVGKTLLINRKLRSLRVLGASVKQHSLHALGFHTLRDAASKHASPRFLTTPNQTLTFRMPIPLSQFFGFMLLALGLGGVIGPFVPDIRLEASYLANQAYMTLAQNLEAKKPELPRSAPVVFQPLKTPDGNTITPINEDFAIVIPKIGVNAPVIANVNPNDHAQYTEALAHGVAHAVTSFLPDGNGTVYLFSHSTNYDWFVKDLNAIFYLIKNLDRGDMVVLIYKGKRYTYAITEKKVVAARATTYLFPTAGSRNLILETCWPPGTTAQRLLIFANLIDEMGQQI